MYCNNFFCILGRIALATQETSPIPTHFPTKRSVCLSSVTLVYSAVGRTQAKNAIANYSQAVGSMMSSG